MPGDVVDPAATRATDRPVVNLVGERVALGPLSPTLLPLYQAWMNDFVTQAWAGYPPRPEPWSDERIADWYQRAATDPERMFLTIYETDGVAGDRVLRSRRHRLPPRHRGVRNDHR